MMVTGDFVQGMMAGDRVWPWQGLGFGGWNYGKVTFVVR